MKPAALPLLIIALAGCATTAQDCDPAQRDVNVLRKAGCVYGGHYQQRVEQKQAVLLDEQQANRLFQATYDALQQESAQVSTDLVAQQVSLDRVRSSINHLLAEIKTKAAGNQAIEQQIGALENRLQSLQLEIEMARSRGEALPVLQQRQQMAELQLGVQDLQAALGLR